MAALDLLGRRWTLRILWELRDGPLGARQLRAACDGMSSSVLYERLHELLDARLVEQGDDGRYGLTALGVQLGEALAPLDVWSAAWAAALDGQATTAGSDGGKDPDATGVQQQS